MCGRDPSGSVIADTPGSRSLRSRRASGYSLLLTQRIIEEKSDVFPAGYPWFGRPFSFAAGAGAKAVCHKADEQTVSAFAVDQAQSLPQFKCRRRMYD
jgi:hypothetical protein